MATGGSGGRNKEQAKETPKKWSRAKDSRSEPESGKYPDYWSFKSRSGHVLNFDDSKGKESVTLQHRSGSAIQMDHEGAIHITAHNSMYTVVFAENRMTVTGAQDITVKGDASMRVYGDLNETVHGNYNLTVMGDYNLTSKNHNRQIRGNMDTHAKNETKKFEGSSAVVAKKGLARVAGMSATFASQGDKVHVGGSSGIHMSVTKEGDFTMHNKKGNFHVTAEDGDMDSQIKGDIKTESKEGDISTKATQGKVGLSAKNNVKVESESGDVGVEANSGKAKVKGSEAGVEGQQSAHISAPSVNVKGSSETIIESSNIQHAGPPAQELDLDIGKLMEIAKSAGLPSVSSMAAGRAGSADEEEDAKGWTQGLLA